MNSQILTIDSIHDGGDARPLKKGGGFVCALILSLVGLVASTPLLAQYDSAQINGSVRDQSGALIPNATVQIQNRDTGLARQTVTNSAGIYVLSQIPPGFYAITASSPGFSSASRTEVELVVSQSATFDFSLRPGSSIETISVSSQTVTLDTSSSSVGATLESKAVTDLPLSGRNISNLLTLQTGVTPINNDQTGGRTNALGTLVSPSIQGQNNRSNVYLLDGVNNNEAVSGSEIITVIPDDIQEMKVLTHTDSPQFGGGLGGTINVITKSGTNRFHGGAWEFWRSSRFFDATSNPSGVLQDLHQNQFGAAIGGPVLLPHYNGKDRTFFYGSYEGFRQTIGSVQQQLVPTAAQLAGDFSALLANKGIQLYNPFTANRTPFPNNQIPSNMIDQNMVGLAKALFPAPTGSYQGGVFNYQSSVPSTHTSDQYDIRGDEYLTRKDLVWAHFLRQNNPIGSYGGFPNLATVTSFTAHNFGAQWIHTFGPTSILTVGVGQNIGTQFHNTTYNGDGNGITVAAGFAQSFACDYPYGRPGCYIPSLGLGSYMGGGEGSETAGGLSGIWEYKADYQKTFGRHTLYVGGNIDTNNLGRTAGGGSTLTFAPFETSNGSTGGDELASLLLSVPDGARRTNTNYWESGGWEDGAYGQDQWKIRNNLTINIGLRYDVSIIPVTHNILGDYYDIFDFVHGTDIIQKLPPACTPTQFAPCVPGGTLPANVVVSSQPKLFFSDKSNFQPRFGVSYTFHPGTVVHAGYGRAYDNWAAVEQSAQNENAWLLGNGALVTNLNNQPGLTPSTVITAENPLAAFNGAYPAPTPFQSIGWATAQQFKNAYSDQWTFGVQQQVARTGVWTINYVGSLGRKIDYCPVANTAQTPGPGPVAPRTPFPYMPQSFFDQPIGQLDYNALETSLQGRSRVAGLSYLVSYTWSKGLNYGTDGWYGIGTTSIQNPYNFKADRSVSGYDLPHVFTAGWVWAVPIGKGGFSTGNRISDYVLGNWQITGIATLESGRVYTVQDAGDIANTGNFNFVGAGYERPNQVGNPKPQHQTPSQWINPAAFVAPAQYTFGNTPRNSLRTEPYKNLDASIFREFPVSESIKLQLRLDAINAFNHPVWGVPNNCQNCQNFGVVTSTVNNARQMQLSGKIVF